MSITITITIAITITTHFDIAIITIGSPYGVAASRTKARGARGVASAKGSKPSRSYPGVAVGSGGLTNVADLDWAVLFKIVTTNEIIGFSRQSIRDGT